MSLPWAAENIRPNLETLSRIGRGDHLSVLKDGENTDEGTYTLGNRGLRSRFKIEGKFKQAFVRSKKGETILSDDQYLQPLTRFFHESVIAWGRNQVTGDLVSGAVRGLQNLRNTYNSDTSRRAKINEIITAVEREVRAIRVEGISVVPGDRRLLLGDQEYRGMKQRILEIVTGARNNPELVTEYSEGVTREFIEAVFGKGPSPKPTSIPVGNLTYTRKHMGVCQQYHKDCHVRTGSKLKGERISCSQEDLSKLFEFLIRDEAMLFAVSQIACQAGVPALHSMLFVMGGRDGEMPVPLIQVGGDRLMLEFGGGGANITKMGGAIIVSSRMEWEGHDPASMLSGAGGRRTLRDYGISNIVTQFAISLQRAGNRVGIDVHEAMLKIVSF